MVQPRILGRVNRDQFVGREGELRQLVRHASLLSDPRSLLVRATPDAGASELLRQAFDQLFARRGEPIPLYFAFKRGEINPAAIARRWFQDLLQQYVAYRAVDPALCRAPLTFNDLLERSAPGDYELVSNLVESFQREQDSPENVITFCLGLPHRFAAEGHTIFVLMNCLAVSPFRDEVAFAQKMISAIARGGGPFVVAGLRRQTADLVHGFDDGETGASSTLHLDRLSDDGGARVVETLARHYQVTTNETTRDLIVQQLNRSPVLIDGFLKSAREKELSLNSFLACQRLYVDELIGGGVKRYFDRVLDLIAPTTQSRRALLRLLYESAGAETHKASLWTWKKRVGLTAPEFERIIDALHVWELVNSSGATVEVNTQSQVWLDYLRAEYRIGAGKEPRAQIVAATLLGALKRAPQTMARKYHRAAAVGLDQLVAGFDCQQVPTILFHYDQFAALYRGEDHEVIENQLTAEKDLMQLPQIVQNAACSAYSGASAGETDGCLVAHGFTAAQYTDENEIVWLCAQIDSKLEASRELTDEWCKRLQAFAKDCRFEKVQIWLVAREGFSESASELLNQLGAYGSSHLQVELLKKRLEIGPAAAERSTDEFEMVIPMGADTEIIAARTVEQIARRVNFRPDAINQIKTALVEACINAAEHSLSPDRKIYQRFQVEDDKLVITVASRGVLPPQTGHNGRASEHGNGNGRRGWGLKLIRTLMDEVEFERVDDGTQLKMTKYIK
jgi:serine/threonine-protein kinase RsbW